MATTRQTPPLMTAVAVRALNAAGALRESTLVATPGGWQLHLNTGLAHYVLRMRDVPEPRLFRTLDGAAAFARTLECARITVDLARAPAARKARRAGIPVRRSTNAG